MEYSNPQIPEGINTSKVHPLKDFAILTGGALVLIGIVLFSLALLADWLAPKIPFSVEQRLTAMYTQTLAPTQNKILSTEERMLKEYLQDLAERLAVAAELPEGVSITVHYLDDDTVNAFATLGGHIVMFRGLLEKLPNENALAMVMAHEIAHIKHRHPIKSLGRGAIFSLAFALVTGATESDFLASFLGQAGWLTGLKFSRSQEEEADATALAAVAARYGHVNGAADLFVVLEQEYSSLEPPALFNSHPHSGDRIAEITHIARRNGWNLNAKTTPLPQIVKQL